MITGRGGCLADEGMRQRTPEAVRTAAVNGELELYDRLDEVLVDRHKVGPLFVVDDDVGQADEQTDLFVDRVRDTIAHRRDEEITDIRGIDCPNADPDLPSFGHSLLLRDGLWLALAPKEFLTLAQLLVLVLAHFFSTFFQNTRHLVVLLGGGV
jgi:hypothetical protein